MNIQTLKLAQSSNMVVNTCLAVRPNEEVLIVADFETEEPVIDSLLLECNNAGDGAVL